MELGWRKVAIQISDGRGGGEAASFSSRLEPRSVDFFLSRERIDVEVARFSSRQILRGAGWIDGLN